MNWNDKIDGPVTLVKTFKPYLKIISKGENSDGGTYRRNVERELHRFVSWAKGEEGPDDWSGIVNCDKSEPSTSDLSPDVFQEYARYLNAQANLKQSTAIVYYYMIAGWVSWCAAERIIDADYADRARQTNIISGGIEERPSIQQRWSLEELSTLRSHVDKAANDAVQQFETNYDKKIEKYPPPSEDIQRKWYDILRAHRNRALVYVIGLTAVRGSEIFRLQEDPRRIGLKWKHVHFDDGYLSVYRKTQSWDAAPMPGPVADALTSYRQWLRNPPEEWPVFQTFHYPTVTQYVKNKLTKRGWNDQTIADARQDYVYDMFLALSEDIEIPSMTTDGCRKTLASLCEEADIEPEKHDYLTPHGARRGIGEILVRQFDFKTAARYLDNSVEVVREHYSHIEAKKLADLISPALTDPETENK
ncbi:site-specific integrase [Salinibaculum salinum]|uniref:tyrosine-type recombinase/integrase n=1 Tax=Salinibaculum salinum TaxID=3131996 RepID=UPI0030EB4EB6